MTRTLADTAAADQLPSLVAELAETDDQVKITHGGVFAAMLISPQKWRSIVETLDILADPGAVADIQEADAEADAGGGADIDEVAALVARRHDAG
ncbi:type II toxin-antitoxin system prevent-host-death family antitoxin [Natronosporangium hydrolyticum]|uniref:Antitoxin n=1 Tax=Natronosporangium hydrolyticum TaxID=2811111 RepID=A0A895YNK1_9ACTN|nr:type II toxin-antitoxin system prevent-host-death family antitoxin [Natronosporangium hydrolyticum]QSB16873.1 type II toxin-antitoxin system prevent-host-death family antitoxin [Natronosporangium hydrolyticum]